MLFGPAFVPAGAVLVEALYIGHVSLHPNIHPS